DAIQYAPAFNGEVCWQLYFGEGYTSSFNTYAGKWVHLKLEVKGPTSQLFIDDMQKPVLITERLETGNTHGSIQITSGHPTMYLSNFKVEHANEPEIHIGQNLTMDSSHYINEWQISKNLPERNFNDENYPRFYDIFNAGWETADSDGRALLNISKYRQIVKDSNCVYAKAIISSEKGKRIKLAFGYSDAVKIYLNKKLIYSGNYAYQSRGNSFTGVIGLNDTLYLDLKKGLNELFIKSSETFGGWGLRFEADQPLQALKIDHPSVTTIGQSKVSNLSPESILHDPKENVIYVTHFDNQFTKHNERKGFISKLSGSGRMLDSLWITGLKAPTGICRRGDKMYVVDREELVEISIKKQKVTAKYKYPENIVFANDVITDPEGNVYITNSDGADKVTDILILEKGKILPWINTIQLQNLNGISYHDGKLLVGNGEDSTLKSVDVVTREVSTITSLGTGIVDGIQVDGNNNYLVS